MPVGNLGVVALHIGDAIAFACYGKSAGVCRHAPVVQNHGGDGNACASRCFNVQAGHAEGAISHQVETEFVGMGEFGADHQGDAETQVGCFAPADVRVGRGCGIKWHD